MADLRRIKCVAEVLKTLKVLKEKGLIYEKNKIIFEIMGRYAVSRRTALEYLQTGLVQFESLRPENPLTLEQLDSALEDIKESKPDAK